jgi:glycosyltransferase involved in cell wall biosynthesis
LAQELGVHQHVILAGYVPDEELVNFYNLCDVFAMPSKGEGFGIVYLEALGCGKPVLAGDQDGAVDALMHGQLGVLVDPDDIGMISQTLIQMLQRIYPHPFLFCPDLLRHQVIDQFGNEHFKKRFDKYLNEFLMQQE